MNEVVLHLITVPLFSAGIGYLTNWSGVWMLFHPVHFKGFTLPGLKTVVSLLPRRIQQIPGVMQSGIGWQGIIPSRAAKMGSISVDKGIAKLGSPSDFYAQLEPEKIAEHILATSRKDMRGLVERILERENPQLWNNLPPQLQEAVHRRVQQQLPGIVHDVTDEIGRNIDQLLDVKLMVIRHLEAHPELANKIYVETGRRELKIIIYAGAAFGLILGIPLALITELLLTQWWVLPIGGVIVGYVTNLLAIHMIFEPVRARKVGPFTVQGLFLRRQKEVAQVYSRLIADDIITLNNIGEELLNGPQSDRTRQMIENALLPSIDRSLGRARAAVRVAVGTGEYDAIKSSVAVEGVDYTMTPLRDPQFNREQSDRVRELIAERMLEMPPKDYSELLRSGMREDEWLLYLHGAVLGFGAGLIHLAIFG